jgi:hypothetical protein
MKKLVFLAFAAFCGGVFFGCSGTGSQGNLLSSSGRAGEVLVVCNGKYWEGILGDSLYAVLMQPVLGLPQIEPMFTASYITENHFREPYKKQRNIIQITIDKSVER